MARIFSGAPGQCTCRSQICWRALCFHRKPLYVRLIRTHNRRFANSPSLGKGQTARQGGGRSNVSPSTRRDSSSRFTVERLLRPRRFGSCNGREGFRQPHRRIKDAGHSSRSSVHPEGERKRHWALIRILSVLLPAYDILGARAAAHQPNIQKSQVRRYENQNRILRCMRLSPSGPQFDGRTAQPV